MGSCCFPHRYSEEEYFRLLILNINIYEYKYQNLNELFNSIESNRYIKKSDLKDKIFPLFLSKQKEYQDSQILFFDFILEELTGTEVDKYEIYLLLFSFLDHVQEDTVDSLYNIIEFLNSNSMNFGLIKKQIFKYYKFNTYTISKFGLNKCVNKDLKKDNFDYLTNTVCNEENIISFLNQLYAISQLSGFSDKDILSHEEVINLLKHVDYSFIKIRDAFMDKYSSK